jgi:hypothetical protein
MGKLIEFNPLDRPRPRKSELYEAGADAIREGMQAAGLDPDDPADLNGVANAATKRAKAKQSKNAAAVASGAPDQDLEDMDLEDIDDSTDSKCSVCGAPTDSNGGYVPPSDAVDPADDEDPDNAPDDDDEDPDGGNPSGDDTTEGFRARYVGADGRRRYVDTNQLVESNRSRKGRLDESGRRLIKI